MLIVVVFGLVLFSATAEECSSFAKCLTCLPEAPYSCTSCEKGYYLARAGASYNCHQCPDACVECVVYNSCTICETGRYGTECRDVCRKGCVNSTCDHDLGFCECKDNYKGSKCDKCIDGKYGYNFNCEMECPTNCKTCISGTNCLRCNDGFYGTMCENICSEGCYLCSKSNGSCFRNNCKPGFHGTDCGKCKNRRYGENCSLFCPKNCESCHTESSCDRCIDGHWGQSCEHNCSHGCSGGECLQESGICLHSACKPGFTGNRCKDCIRGKFGFYCNLNATFDGHHSTAVHMKHTAPGIILVIWLTRLLVTEVN